MSQSTLEAGIARLLGDRRLVVLLVLALLALLLSITLRWPTNRVVLTIDTGAASMRFAERIELADLDHRIAGSGPLRLYGVPELDAAPHLDAGAAKAPVAATIAGPTVLQSLRVGAGSAIELRLQQGDGMDLVMRGSASLDIELVQEGGELRVVGADGAVLAPARIGEPAEIVAAARQPTDRMRLRLPTPTRDAPLVLLEDLRISALSFGRERGGHDDRLPFRSAVTGGTLRMQDIGRSVTLQPGDPIWLEDFDGIVTSLRVDEGGIRLHVLGTAARVAVGPPDFEEELTPTMLTYLYNREGLKALWGSFLFVLAALWQLRGWARARSS